MKLEERVLILEKSVVQLQLIISRLQDIEIKSLRDENKNLEVRRERKE